MRLANLDEPERSIALDRFCGTDTSLRADVQELLSSDATSAAPYGRSLDQETIEHLDPDTTGECIGPGQSPGDQIGRYKLLEQIGEGGFGTVWAAEQREPVKRRVALKIIKLGMDTKQVIARFEAERQALAMMDHPNIAKVLDAGSTETGRPFFAMELVKGVPILDYCDTETMDTRDRLGLFMKVCHAIQHAHQKGIIHRDIKPSNVLVTLHDGVPVPKVIDFGIAKATNQELTDKTLYTQHRQMIGTPAYMSPEQAEMSGLDIDTRSDIYALGVLLYELLTGTTPFENQSLMEVGLAEMMRVIREETPHKPSTRLSSLGDTSTRTAEQRRTDVNKLNLSLRGDLDWIVMKCLEKDRSRRYDTANGLAADILRHLNDEPVAAGPPSASYKLRKFVKRNRSHVIASGVIATILVAGIVGTSTGMVWALSERGRADREATRANKSAAAEAQARERAEANEQKALEEAERAERELARATEIKRLITEMLQSVDPAEAQGADTALLKGILDDASERLSKHEITDELIAAELHALVGEVYLSLGLYPQAEEHLPVTVEIRTRVQGEAHVDTLGSMNNLAGLYMDQGRYTEAERLYVDALATQHREMGEEHPYTSNMMNNLAGLYFNLGRYSEAEPLFIKTLEIQQRLLGDEHPTTLGTLANLAGVYLALGRYTEAEPLYLKTLEIQRRVLGDEHPETLGTMTNVANLYADQGRFAEAEMLYVEGMEIKKRVLGEEHQSTLGTITNLGLLYNGLDRYEEAALMFETSLAIKRRVLGLEHPWTGFAMEGLATAYLHLHRREEAVPLYREWLGLQTAVADAPDADADTLDSAAWTLLIFEIEQVRDPTRALAYATRACTLEQAAGGPNLWTYLDTLALAQHLTGDTATAIETQQRALSLAPEGQELAEYEQRLDEYLAALGGPP